VRDDNDPAFGGSHQSDLCREGCVYLPMGSLHLAWRKFLWMGTLYQELRVENQWHAARRSHHRDAIRGDFADIYEVRGLKRKARGQDLDPELTDREVTLGYRGLDGVVRRTRLQFTPRRKAWLAAVSALRSPLRQSKRSYSTSQSDANENRSARGSWFSNAREQRLGRNWTLKWRSSASLRRETGSSTHWLSVLPPTCT